MATQRLHHTRRTERAHHSIAVFITPFSANFVELRLCEVHGDVKSALPRPDRTRRPQEGRRLRVACYNAVTSKPTVGNDFDVPDREQGKTVHTSYAFLCLRGAGGTRHPCVGRSAVSVGPPLALAASRQVNNACGRPDRARSRRRRMPISSGIMRQNSGVKPAVILGDRTGADRTGAIRTSENAYSTQLGG